MNKLIHLNKYTRLYEENKLLDDKFDKLYDNNSKDIITKNILALLIELGELGNESRCFKYWSTKKPSEDKIILEEFADCLLVTLFFCNHLNVCLEEDFNEVEQKNIIEQFICLYKEVSLLLEDYHKERAKNILVNLIYLGYLLGYTDEDLISAGLTKINKNNKRFATGFNE